MATKAGRNIAIIGTDRKAMRGVEKPDGQEGRVIAELIRRDGYERAVGVLTHNDWLRLDTHASAKRSGLPANRVVPGYGYTLAPRKARGVLKMDWHKGKAHPADRSLLISSNGIEAYHYQKSKGAGGAKGGRTRGSAGRGARYNQRVNPCGNYWRLDETIPLA